MSKNRPFWVKWYKTSNWHRLRYRVLSRNPLCKFCGSKGLIVEASVVDHINPHKGDINKFFDINNLQSLCAHCHNSTKQRLEKSGEFGCDINGFVKGWD